MCWQTPILLTRRRKSNPMIVKKRLFNSLILSSTSFFVLLEGVSIQDQLQQQVCHLFFPMAAEESRVVWAHLMPGFGGIRDALNRKARQEGVSPSQVRHIHCHTVPPPKTPNSPPNMTLSRLVVSKGKPTPNLRVSFYFPLLLDNWSHLFLPFA